MIYSMTGYGKAAFEFNGKSFTIEIKSLNSKQADTNIKIPSLYKEKEIDLRNIIVTELKRGKIELILSVTAGDKANVPTINKAVAKNYFKQVAEILTELDIPEQQNILTSILRLPEVLNTEQEELDTAEWEAIKTNLLKAIDDLKSFRLQEGSPIEADFRERISIIQKNLDSIAGFEGKRIEAIKSRIKNNLFEFISPEKVDENRFEQEVLFYLEKMDITEEKIRLKNHCEYFLKTLELDESIGKKLNFISQEIGREINTIGSKANDADIQRFVVVMKDELEKIKEQTMNVL